MPAHRHPCAAAIDRSRKKSAAYLTSPGESFHRVQARELSEQHKLDHPEWRFTRNTKKKKVSRGADSYYVSHKALCAITLKKIAGVCLM